MTLPVAAWMELGFGCGFLGAAGVNLWFVNRGISRTKLRYGPDGIPEEKHIAACYLIMAGVSHYMKSFSLFGSEAEPNPWHEYWFLGWAITTPLVLLDVMCMAQLSRKAPAVTLMLMSGLLLAFGINVRLLDDKWGFIALAVIMLGSSYVLVGFSMRTRVVLQRVMEEKTLKLMTRLFFLGWLAIFVTWCISDPVLGYIGRDVTLMMIAICDAGTKLPVALLSFQLRLTLEDQRAYEYSRAAQEWFLSAAKNLQAVGGTRRPSHSNVVVPVGAYSAADKESSSASHDGSNPSSHHSRKLRDIGPEDGLAPGGRSQPAASTANNATRKQRKSLPAAAFGADWKKALQEATSHKSRTPADLGVQYDKVAEAPNVAARRPSTDQRRPSGVSTMVMRDGQLTTLDDAVQKDCNKKGRKQRRGSATSQTSSGSAKPPRAHEYAFPPP